VRVEDGSGSVIAEYYYDPFGCRLWKEVAGVRTYFCYADEGLVAEFDASGNQTKEYGYRPDSTWTTDPLFMEQGGQYYFYQNDHLGTPQQVTSESGAVVWAAQYDAFGKATVDASSTVTNNLRFPGQYYDEETGLHYNWNRYYDPGTGRYTTEDPIGFESGDLSLYLYASASPLVITDPLGLYGRDMHYDYTYGIAKGLGYSKCAYEKIAEADNNVDIKYNPVQLGDAAVKIREQWHFPTQDRVNELLNNAFNSCDLVALGQALHVLQDSYSHAGYGAKWGHWRKKPDLLTTDPAKTQRVTKETMEVLKTFESKCWDASRDRCCDK